MSDDPLHPPTQQEIDDCETKAARHESIAQRVGERHPRYNDHRRLAEYYRGIAAIHRAHLPPA